MKSIPFLDYFCTTGESKYIYEWLGLNYFLSDPGYLNTSRLILTTTLKDSSHFHHIFG